MPHNQEEIIKALNLFFQPGDVFEVRCLDASIPGMRYPHTESGYFDYDHIASVSKELEKITARGVYFTPNPVNPALLARAANRIKVAGKDESTSDADILCRRWLLIDCDPVRPAKISSNEEEHSAALAKAQEIRAGLASMNWPDPVMLDSGNGAQLMYRIALPTADTGLVQACLKALSPVGNKQVKIDLSVHNPARIWRLPGTWNCKGDQHEDRVYRQAKILSIPAMPMFVSEELLYNLVGESTPSLFPRPVTSSGFDLEAWIAQHCPELEGPESWKDSRRWVFPVCPFNDAHSNRSAVIIQQASGAVAFKCHHNGCFGKDWHALRELKEGSGNSSRAELPEVDFTALLNSVATTNPPNPVNDSNPIVPLPKELHNMPGLVNSVMEFSMQGAAYPNRTASFAGAMALMAHLTARKVSLRGIRTNPYFVVLAKSGVGKDYPRKVNNHILGKLGVQATLVATVSSTAGLEDALAAHPALLWQSDEFYSFLNEAANDKSGRIEAILAMILMLFSSAGESITTRLLAGKTPAAISCPNLVALTTSTPAEFFSCLTDRMLAGGFLSRMTVMLSENRSRGQAQIDPGNIPENLIVMAKKWHEFIPPGSGNLDVRALEVPVSPEAEIKLKELQNRADDKYEECDRGSAEDWRLSIWSRAFEHILKFCLIYACSEASEPRNVQITLSAVEWAEKFVFWEVEQLIAMTGRNHYKNEFARVSRRVLDILEQWHRNHGTDTPMEGRDFNRKVQELPPNYLKAVIERLVDQELIKIASAPTRGRPKIMYSLA